MSAFVIKPSLGWIHSNEVIANEGVIYKVTYIGSMEVKVSMKKLNFKTRSNVAKECINRVCEYAKLKTVDEIRKIDKQVSKVLDEVPNLLYTGTSVNLKLSSTKLTLTSSSSNNVIASHEMSKISFASLGDSDTIDFVGYIAKDAKDLRVCFVIKCIDNTAKDILSTIGQAFQMKYQQFANTVPVISVSQPEADTHHDYYNDLPGKVPPDITYTQLTPNLIDLHADGVLRPIHDYVNDCVTRERDVFDMQPFTHHTVHEKLEDPLTQLENEIWFHGQINRLEAENLLKKDGDFLVREQRNTSQRQFVLSGMCDNNKIHLLLIDPDGVIRTKDKVFRSVSDLVGFHYENALPIISADSTLVLRHKILRALVQ